MKVAIIGAGAAGCFCALNLKRSRPDIDISVFEQKQRALAKVAITGGGRCNLTNTFAEIDDLRQAYPRGFRLMQRLFHSFSPEQTREWWEDEGVPLVVQPDQCVFPKSQDAMQIVLTLLRGMQRAGVHLFTEAKVENILPHEDGCSLQVNGEQRDFDKVVITTGGAPRMGQLSFLQTLNLNIVQTVPSLFALKINDASLCELMGTVIGDCQVSIPGTKFKATGDVLITHFGLSGPAILRLSSYAAPYLAEKNYCISLSVNWMGGLNQDETNQRLQSFMASHHAVEKEHPSHLTARHWAQLLQRAGVPAETLWDRLNAKERNRLVNTLSSDVYTTTGRSLHRQEFVTCGGVSLSEVNASDLSLKRYPNIYLAGEVLDVDAITGGFNLQAAWTMGWVVSCAIMKEGIS